VCGLLVPNQGHAKVISRSVGGDFKVMSSQVM
jgi:hypothetical protein